MKHHPKGLRRKPWWRQNCPCACYEGI